MGKKKKKHTGMCSGLYRKGNLGPRPRAKGIVRCKAKLFGHVISEINIVPNNFFLNGEEWITAGFRRVSDFI